MGDEPILVPTADPFAFVDENLPAVGAALEAAETVAEVQFITAMVGGALQLAAQRRNEELAKAAQETAAAEARAQQAAAQAAFQQQQAAQTEQAQGQLREFRNRRKQ